ncbi:MAG TPA: class II aldolase/adducin family protein [Stellaceae bacterium]|nr:class II aldolase/adducin family protein [Stellaceae bacterium]
MTDPALGELLADLVAANHVLYDQQVLDGLGHVSVRDPRDPQRFLMARALAPGLVAADDILTFDLDGKAVEATRHAVYIERFIHAEIYRSRGDANAVVHSHSPAVIPFGVTTKPMQPVSGTAAFLALGVPVFEIRDLVAASDLLISTAELGKALARTLGSGAVALLRGHGNVVVGSELREVVSRAIYTEINARLQMQAIAIGGPINYVSADEAAAIGRMGATRGREGLQRSWAMWREQAERHRR